LGNGFFFADASRFVAESLQKWAKSRAESDVRGKLQLCEYDDDAKIRHTFSIKVMAGRYSFLVWKDTDDEVVLDIPAFIASCDLPPVTKKKR
jgi:hypothetical protein